jgi:3-dehydroquinate synthase/shikimate kinase/3-dehydroquinate synthase
MTSEFLSVLSHVQLRTGQKSDSQKFSMIVLVGFMGAGKTTIGYLLSGKLGLPFVDIDVLIEQQQGCTIPEIFADRGERIFRAIEHETITNALRGPDAVLAFGGGAVEYTKTLEELWHVTVIYLEVSFEEAIFRIGHDAYRPNSVRSDVDAVYERRLPIYERIATTRIPTDGRRPESIVVDAVATVLSIPQTPRGAHSTLVTPTGGSYWAHVGHGILNDFERLLPTLTHAAQAFVISAGPDAVARAVIKSLDGRGFLVHTIAVPAGSRAKQLDVVRWIVDWLADCAAHSDDLIVGLGGESTCDVAGFVAAIYNRGMPLALVPTTLVAQVDSAVGGKNAINLEGGRNLLGTIHQPIVVMVDVAHAGRFGDDGFAAGLSELVKHALVVDEELFDLLGKHRQEIKDSDPKILGAVVARSVAAKARIISADEREDGERVNLNYGHTFAHAIEYVSGEPEEHGAAVSLGMMAAAHLAYRLGRTGDDLVSVHRDYLRGFGLPIARRLPLASLKSAWLRDKKYRGVARFIVLNGIRRPESGVIADDHVLTQVLDDLAAEV